MQKKIQKTAVRSGGAPWARGALGQGGPLGKGGSIRRVKSKGYVYSNVSPGSKPNTTTGLGEKDHPAVERGHGSQPGAEVYDAGRPRPKPVAWSCHHHAFD